MSDKFSSLLSKLRKQYPLLSDLIDNVDIIDRREQGMDRTGRKLEWQEAYDDRYDKHVMEIFDPTLKGSELDQAVLGELLHSAHKYVPEYNQMREQLKSQLSNSDVNNLIGLYEQSGDNRSFDKWFDHSGLDAFIRGHAVSQWPDSKYTDSQKKLIDKMMGVLQGKTDMDKSFNPAGTWDQSPEDEAAGIERAKQGGGQTLEVPAYQSNAPETSLRPRLRPEDPEMSSTTGMMGTDAQGNLMEYGIEPDVMMANMGNDGTQSVLINDPELEMLRSMLPPPPDQKPSLDYIAPEDETLGSFRNMDIKTLYPVAYRDTSGNDVGSAGPMATSGLHYIDTRGNGDRSMSGDETPTHLQKLQDTTESFVSSQMFVSAMDQMRSQLDREAQKNLRGSMFGEQGDDGLFHLFVGDDDTGYTEMTYGKGEEGMRDAKLDARKALNYASQMLDSDMDGGFMGRVAMAHTYRGYEDSDLERMQADLAREARETVARDGSMGNPNVGANIAAILEQSEKVGDEQKRRGGKKETRGFDYSARVLSREMSEKAKGSM